MTRRTNRVYFAHSEGRIKIGTTSKPVPERLRQISRSLSSPLQVIGFVIGGYRFERKVHAMLGAFHLEGEWFRDCPEIRKSIDALIVQGGERYERRAQKRPSQSDGLTTDQLQRLIAVLWPDDPTGGFAAFVEVPIDVCKTWTSGAAKMPKLIRTALACRTAQYVTS